MDFLNKLPKIPFLGDTNSNREYFFAVNINLNKVEAAVWTLDGKNLHVLNVASTSYASQEEMSDAANFVLDEALGNLPFDPKKVLFGIPETWLQDDNLKPEYLSVLKKISHDVDLEPMAYVSTPHAISHFLQKQQGVPTTAVLVEVADPIIVSVVKAGKIVGTKEQKRSENLPDDIEKTLLSFSNVEVLPSKILLYGFEKLDKYKDELASFSWMSQLPFLHLPKIETLENAITIKALCFAGASELNPAVVFHPDHFLTMATAEKAARLTRPLEEANVVPARVKQPEEDTGFSEGDIEERYEREENSMEGGDRNGQAVMVPQPGNVPYPQETYSNSPLDRAKALVATPFLALAKKTNLAAFNLPGGGGLPFRLPGMAILFPLALLLVVGILYLFFTKADVTVFVDMKTLEKDSQVTADPAISAVDEANKKIPAKVIETQIDGTAKAQATGKKQIGDPAKGTVVLYNKTYSPKTFSQGTILTGSNNLTFTLDSTVNIASQSAVEGGISFGKATANVTATKIGPDGNIAAGTELSIKDQPTSNYNAKADQAFSGGVSKDVTVVTADDQKKLLASLASDLRQKAKDQLQGKLTGDLKILPEGMSEQIISQRYTKNAGDQASDFSLSLTVSYKGTAYSEGDLKSIVSKLVETNVPEGYTLDLAATETQSDVSKVEKDGRLVFVTKFKAKLMPKVDNEKVKRDIASKSPEVAADRLKQIENVIGSDIRLKPNLPKPFGRLPFLSKNINLEFRAK